MNKTTLSVSRVVNVSTFLGARAATSRSFGAMLILGASDVIDADERIRDYANISDVLDDFGVDTPEYRAAVAFFGVEPKPRSVQIGRWVKAASCARIVGRILTEDEKKMEAFKSASSGSITFTIGEDEVAITGLDLSKETNLNGVASKVTGKLESKATVEYDGLRFVLKTNATGKSAKAAVKDAGSVGRLLGFDEGVRYVAGRDAETAEEAVAALLDMPSWYGMIVAEKLEKEDAVKVATLISASELKHVVGFTSNDTAETDAQASDTLGQALHDAKFSRAIVQYSSSHPHAVAPIFGRMATVNFKGENTTITLKFKQEPGVVAEGLRASQANALEKKCVNVFAAYNNDTAILQEGVCSSGDFIDEIHGLDWLENTIQTALWNLLYTSDSKVGQTDADMTKLIAACNDVLEIANKNGLVAKGKWNGAEFGALKKGDTLPTGYYVFIDSVDNQLQEDRESRKAPPVMIAVKLKGAVHFIDVSIRVNR